MPTSPPLRDITFSSADIVLAGSLAVPDRGPAVPGVVMVGGSGPADRNNDSYFPPIRRHLMETGIAVLSYDKRGVGASSGDWRDATMDDLAGDASAGLDFLRAQDEVRADAVGLFGHSEGGWVVLRAAAARNDLPWVITNSCPGMTPAAQDRYALANALARADASQQDIDATLALYDRLIEKGRAGGDFAAVGRLVDRAQTPSVFADYWADVDERLWEFLKRKQDHDPIPDARSLRCPHLALFGGVDELVPVADSIRRFGAAACHPDRDRRATLTIKVFPGADHRIQVGIGSRLVPGYLNTLTHWIKTRRGIDPDN